MYFRLIIIAVMDKIMNAFTFKKQKQVTYSSIKRNRAIRSQKKFVHSTEPCQHSPKTTNSRQIKQIIDSVPQDQQFIQNCIEQLREKLQQIKNQPKKKQSHPFQGDNVFRRKNIQTKQYKPRVKSIQIDPQPKIISKSMNLRYLRKQSGQRHLANLNQVRNQIKRQKQSYNRPKNQFQKDNIRHRYEQQYNRNPSERIRSNTQQMSRSQSNRARIYRYMSDKKQQAVGDVNNSFVFDKIINVNHNINIYNSPTRNQSPKIRLKRQQSQQQNHQRHSSSRRPINSRSKLKTNQQMKETIIQNGQKIGDISTINAKKQTLNFLGESCIGIKQELNPQQRQHVQKLLDMIGWKTQDIKKALGHPKQSKRKQGLDRISKIFPKGFFS